MSYCLNPHCSRPENPAQSNFCRNCGGRLRLRDRYLPIAPIGQGGFGRTFKAIDEDKPSKPFCVIKQFFPQIEGTTAAQKAAELFTQEAIALEQLNDPNIPKLDAYFITPDGRQYLVQEFIDGQNLQAELIEQGTFTADKIRELLVTLLPTLAYFHELGLIHRDIKPENIIRRSDNRQLYLVDFGAAKITATNQSQGTSIGTPEFMAPEQAWGRAFPASDLYSLGVTCLYLLTGISPFQLFEDDRGEWIWQKFLSQPIESQLATILDRLIATKPVERYQTAQAAITALAENTPNLPSELDHSPIISAMSSPSNVITAAHQWECIQTLTWHSKPIHALAIFTSGKYLISGDDGGTVAVWNLTMGQPIGTYCTNNAIYAVAASPNQSQIASGDRNRRIQLRRWESIGNSLKELRPDPSSLDSHSGYIYTVQFSPNGKILASGGADRRIRLWNADTGKIIFTLDGHQESVTALQFMPNSQILISASADLTIRFWDLVSKQLLKTITAHTQKIHCLTISGDGQLIVSGSSDRTVRFRQLGTTDYHTLTGHQEGVLTVAISPDGKTIASGAIDGMVNLWDVVTCQLLASFQAHQSAVKSVVFHPLDCTLISAGWDREIKRWRQL